LDTISNLKENLLYLKHEIIPEKEKIRLFFGGKELKENKKICFYKIEEGNFIQML